MSIPSGRSLPRDDSIPSDLGRFRDRFATERARPAFFRRWRHPRASAAPAARKLSRQLDLSRTTAWSWLHKLRVALDDRNQAPPGRAGGGGRDLRGGLEEGRGDGAPGKRAWWPVTWS